jgi:hypothetical protein
MTTLTIKVNEKTKAGKTFMAMSENFFKGVKGIEIVENENGFHNKDFIEKIKKAEGNIKKGNTKRLNPNDIWGSLGLK